MIYLLAEWKRDRWPFERGWFQLISQAFNFNLRKNFCGPESNAMQNNLFSLWRHSVFRSKIKKTYAMRHLAWTVKEEWNIYTSCLLVDFPSRKIDVTVNKNNYLATRNEHRKSVNKSLWVRARGYSRWSSAERTKQVLLDILKAHERKANSQTRLN